MSDSRHTRLGELFLAASELPDGQRLTFLRQQSPDDPELVEEVLGMLQAEADAPSDLAMPVLSSERGERAPQRIGEYEILRTLGEGGMGIVYEARQERPSRKVALKVLRFAGHRDTLRRFEHEAEVLGWLQHPAIAHVYEAGVASGPDGDRSYFAMELVDGLPIDRWADARDLDVEGRLKLIARVGEGVRHAHQKGVVHRDLKPANILVGADGQPKILDFGVARVAAQDDAGHTVLTRAGQIVGTLGYMSPEQVLGDPSAIDTRSDVYALGVLTYELLAGRRPLDLRDLPVPRALGRIANEEPPRLSTVAPEAPDDVVTIVHKALEKDRDRRYGSVEAFIDDILRFLGREPIRARPPSAIYQLRRFVQRHRGVAVAATIAFVAVTVGAITSTVLFLSEQDALAAERETSAALETARSDLEQSLAETRRNLALLQETSLTFSKMLRNPIRQVDGTDVLMVDLLRAVAAENRARSRPPEIRVWLATTLGWSFSGIKKYDDALEQAEIGRAACEEAADPMTAARIMLHELFAAIYTGTRRFAEAEAELDAGRSLLEELPPEANQLATARRVGLDRWRAQLFSETGRSREALAVYDRLLERERSRDRFSWASLASNRARVLQHEGRFAEAEAAAQQAIETIEALGPAYAGWLYTPLSVLSVTYHYTGRVDQSIATTRRMLEISRNVLGELHPTVAVDCANLATSLRSVGKLDEAAALYDEAVEIAGRSMPVGHPVRARNLSQRGSLHFQRGRWDDGEADLEAALAMLEGQSGQEADMLRAEAQGYLSMTYRNRGEYDRAIELLRESLDAKRRLIHAPRHPVMLLNVRDLGRCYLALEDYEEAFEWTLETLAICCQFQGPQSPSSKTARQRCDEVVEKLALAGVEVEPLNQRIEATVRPRK